MPTLFKWKYTGSSLEHRGEQRVFPGDRVYVDGREDLGLLSSIEVPLDDWSEVLDSLNRSDVEVLDSPNSHMRRVLDS